MDRLPPVPTSPNAVSSQASPSDRQHHIAPLRALGPQTLDRAIDWLLSHQRGEVVARGPAHAHVVVTTPLLRFRDDVHLLWDEAAGLLHVRSASRVGHGDLGTNRRRVEALRRAVEGA